MCFRFQNLPIKQFFGVEITGVKMLIDFKLGTDSWGTMLEEPDYIKMLEEKGLKA